MAAAAEAFLSSEEAVNFGHLCHLLAPGATDDHIVGVQVAHAWRERSPGAPAWPWEWRVVASDPDIMIESMKEWNREELRDMCRRKIPPAPSLLHKSCARDIMTESVKEWSRKERCVKCRRK